LKLEKWPIERLQPSPRNARKHPKAQIAEIAASIQSFGFSNPILVTPDGEIIAGHGRLAAAKQIEMREVLVIVIGNLTDQQKRELMLADNRIALNAGWNREMLERELKELSLLGSDLEALGFTVAELNVALGQVSINGLTDEDDVPAVQDQVISRAGDIWCLGDHRLACGDCTDPDLVARLVGSHKPNLMVTDPPYGVRYDPTWRHRGGLNQSKRTGVVQNDHRADWRDAWRLFPGTIAYVWHGALHASTVAASLEAESFQIRSQIIWAKPRMVIGRGDYHWQHEPCWYAVRDKGHWTGDRKQTTLWTIHQKGEDAETTHGTQKPVECMRRPMQNNTIPGDAIYEPFSGSGTTLIAAESSKRVCFAVEIDPRYVDMAVRRWQNFTGRQAVRQSDGASFDTVSSGAADAPSRSATPTMLATG
jgi:DNA modification methylase